VSRRGVGSTARTASASSSRSVTAIRLPNTGARASPPPRVSDGTSTREMRALHRDGASADVDLEPLTVGARVERVPGRRPAEATQLPAQEVPAASHVDAQRVSPWAPPKTRVPGAATRRRRLHRPRSPRAGPRARPNFGKTSWPRASSGAPALPTWHEHGWTMNLRRRVRRADEARKRAPCDPLAPGERLSARAAAPRAADERDGYAPRASRSGARGALPSPPFATAPVPSCVDVAITAQRIEFPCFQNLFAMLRRKAGRKCRPGACRQEIPRLRGAPPNTSGVGSQPGVLGGTSRGPLHGRPACQSVRSRVGGATAQARDVARGTGQSGLPDISCCADIARPPNAQAAAA